MSVVLDRGVRTTAAPYLHEWAGAVELDLTDTGTDAPLLLPDSWTMAQDQLVLCMGVASATVTASFALIAVDTRDSLNIILGQIQQVCAIFTPARTQEVDGVSTIHVYELISFDLRRLPNHSKIKMYLALSVTSGAGAKYLIDWNSTHGRSI